MIRLLFIVVIGLLVWQLVRVAARMSTTTIEEARTVGLQEAAEHIENPILLDDYLNGRRVSREQIEALIEEGRMPSYEWRQYIFIENRELVTANR
mgnify:FL=1